MYDFIILYFDVRAGWLLFQSTVDLGESGD